MAFLILKIAGLLRACGIPVSTGEIVDCLKLLSCMGQTPIDRSDFYTLINAALIKEAWGRQFILWLVELYFGPDPELAGDRLGRLTAHHPAAKKNMGEASKGAMVDTLFQAISANDLKQVHLIFSGMNLEFEPEVEDFDQALGLMEAECGWLEVSPLLGQPRIKKELCPERHKSSLKALNRWHALIEARVEQWLKQNMGAGILVETISRLNPLQASFVDCREDQVPRICREVRKMGKQLATRKGRRKKPGSGRTISFPRTVRQSLKTCGIPMDLVKMCRKQSKPDLWLICDISNSVRQFVYFMLALVYSSHRYYSRIRSFFFVDRIVEATDYFKENDWETVLLNLKSVKGANATGFSDYG